LVELPSFFNKPDFIGVLLPGYIAVTLVVVQFFPNLAQAQEGKGLSLDFFSAVVFLVAGPAVGYTLRQLHRIFYTVITMRKKEQRKKAIEQYYALRIAIVTDAERTELDISEGQYDFNISTFMVLMGTGIYISIEYGLSFAWNSIPVIVASIIFFIGGYLERKEGFIPLYTKLVRKHNV
jgi:hypothetical protein